MGAIYITYVGIELYGVVMLIVCSEWLYTAVHGRAGEPR